MTGIYFSAVLKFCNQISAIQILVVIIIIITTTTTTVVVVVVVVATLQDVFEEHCLLSIIRR